MKENDVDVLEVLNALAEGCAPESLPSFNEFHAAIATLIAEAPEPPADPCDTEIARLRNALEHIAGSCAGRAAEVAKCALAPPEVQR